MYYIQLIKFNKMLSSILLILFFCIVNVKAQNNNEIMPLDKFANLNDPLDIEPTAQKYVSSHFPPGSDPKIFETAFENAGGKCNKHEKTKYTSFENNAWLLYGCRAPVLRTVPSTERGIRKYLSSKMFSLIFPDKTWLGYSYTATWNAAVFVDKNTGLLSKIDIKISFDAM